MRMLVSFKVILAADFVGRLLSLLNTHHWNTNLFTLGEGGSLRVKEPGEEVDADLGHNILELIKVHESRQSLTDLNNLVWLMCKEFLNFTLHQPNQCGLTILTKSMKPLHESMCSPLAIL